MDLFLQNFSQSQKLDFSTRRFHETHILFEMRETIAFIAVSLMTLTLSSMSIYESLQNSSPHDFSHNVNALAVVEDTPRRWIGFVCSDSTTYWIGDGFQVPEIYTIRKIFECSTKSTSFVQILSESSYDDEAALYAMYAKTKFGVESIAIDSTGKHRERFEHTLNKNQAVGIHIFNDMNHLTRKDMILRIVLRTDEDAKRALSNFINQYLASAPAIVIVDLVPGTQKYTDMSKELQLLDTISNANYKVYSARTQSIMSPLDMLSNLEVLYENRNSRERLVFFATMNLTKSCI